MAEDYIESLGGSISATNALQVAMNNIPNNLELGATFDATEAMNALMDLGFTADQAVAYLNKLGFSVRYETRKAWLYDGVLYENPPTGVEPKDVKPVTILEAAGTKLGPSYSPSGGGGGGGSNNYENGYDRLHNTLQEINDVLRERERLERQYQRLLDRNLATAK